MGKHGRKLEQDVDAVTRTQHGKSHVYCPITALLLEIFFILRPRLYGEKLSRVEGSPAYPSYPGRANFSYNSLQNLANHLQEKQKVGSARRATRLARSPFCDGRVRVRVNFSSYKHFGSLSRVNSVKARRSEHARSALGWGKGVNFFLI